MAAKPTPSFEVGERVLCYNHSTLYDAKVLKIKTEADDIRYHVHYIGWKSTWDEDVTEDQMLKRTEENLRKQHEMMLAAQVKRKADGKDEAESPAEFERGPKRVKTGPGFVGSTAGGSTSEPTRKKTIIELPLPENIIAHLVNDWEMITKDQRLTEQPRSPTVAEILDRFSKSEAMVARRDEGTKEILDALQLYFDVALGKMLLYRFERQQYATICSESGDKTRMSNVYGCEHLLRLLVKLPQLISNNIHMTREAQAILTGVLTDLAQFLSNNLSEFVQEVYDNAPSSYISISKSF